MKKTKIFALLLAVVLTLSLFAACGSSDSGSSDSGGSDSASSDSGSSSPSDSGNSDAAPAEEDKPVTLTYSFHLPAGNAYETTLALVNEKLEEYNSNVTIEFYPGGTLLSESELYEGVINGVADMGFLAISNDAGRFPLLYLLEYPGV
jgi:TRAP-type C4-dicarboxylate transport system substrate-binding protein